MKGSGAEEFEFPKAKAEPFQVQETVDEDDSASEWYAYFNLPKDCSTEDLHAAYKRLALIWHPDRHTDEESRAHATAKFARLTHIHDVLTDPARRKIYDLYGEKGLTSGLELGAHLQTPEQIQALFQRHLSKKNRKILETKLGLSGMLQAAVDLDETLSPFLDPEPDIVRIAGYSQGPKQKPALQSVMLAERFTTNVSRKDTVELQGQLLAKAGKGASLLAVTAKRQFSSRSWAKLSGQMGVGAGDKPLAVTACRAISSMSQAKISLKLATMFAQLRCAAMRNLYKGITGKIQYILGGPEAGVRLRGTRAGERMTLSGMLWVGIRSWSFGGMWHQRLSEKSTFSTSINVGEGGPKLDLTGRRKISGNSTFSCACSLSMIKGVTLKLSVGRMGQDLSIPILLSQKLTLRAVVAGTVLPSIVATLLKVFWIRPRAKLRKQRKLQKMRAENAEEILKARREAKNDVELMQFAVNRKRQQEENRNGLIILKAVFGRLPERTEVAANRRQSRQGEDWPQIDDSPQSSSIEVTTPLQYLLEDSKLQLFNSSKSGLPGFCDPAPGEEKQLYILYRFKGRLHEVIVRDNQPVYIPLQRDLLPAHTVKIVNGQPIAQSSGSSRNQTTPQQQGRQI